MLDVILVLISNFDVLAGLDFVQKFCFPVTIIKTIQQILNIYRYLYIFVLICIIIL